MGYSPILIAIDPDDDIATSKALIELCLTKGVEVEALGVAPRHPVAGANLTAAEAVRRYETILDDDLARRLSALPIEKTEIAAGRLQEVASARAVALEAGMVVKPADRPAGKNAPLFGAMEKKLLRKTSVPTLILRDGFDGPRIGVAVDAPSDNDREHEQLNERLVDQGLALAELTGAKEVVLIHAWSSAGAALLESPRVGLSPAEVKKAVDDWEEDRQRWLTRFAEQVGVKAAKQNLLVSTKLVMGPTHTAIVSAAEDADLSVLVAATVNRSGLAGLFIGNTAESLIDAAPCSLLIVKPEEVERLLTSLIQKE